MTVTPKVALLLLHQTGDRPERTLRDADEQSTNDRVGVQKY